MYNASVIEYKKVVTLIILFLRFFGNYLGSSVIQYSFSPINGINIIQIEESSWDALPEGSVTINFFVSDTVGNIHTIPVIINKDLPSEPGIPFGNYYILFLGVGIISILLVERKKRKK